MKSSLIVLFIILITFNYNSFSQSTFDEGFIINSQQDTTYGLIQYTPYKSNDVSLFFKRSKGDSVQVFSITDIRAFGFAQGEYYESMNLSSLEVFDGVYFVKVLLRSEISLYLTSKGFILDKGNILSFLPLPSLLDAPDVATRLQLETELERSNLLIAAETLANSCQTASFFDIGFKTSERPLIKVVKAYNDCVGAPYVEYKNNLAWVSPRLGLLAGLNSSNLSFFDIENFPFLNNSEFENINSLIVGIEVKFDSPRFKNRLGASIGLQYQETNYYGFSNIKTLTTNSAFNDIYINMSFIRIPVGFSYQVNTSNWPVILSSGVNFNRPIKSDYRRVEQNVSGLQSAITVRPIEYKEEVRLLPNTQGFWLGIGTRNQLGKRLDLGLDLRYEMNNRITDLNSSTRNLQLLISLIY